MKVRGSALDRTLRYLYLRFIRLHGSPKDVARGLALGVFIGMTPTMGIQTPLALFGAMLLKENKLAAMIGVWISNPMTFIPLYTFNFKMGKYLLGTHDIRMPTFTSIEELMALGHDFLLPLIVGSVVAGIITSAISYVIFLNIFTAIKFEKEKLKQRKEHKKIIENTTEGEEGDQSQDIR